MGQDDSINLARIIKKRGIVAIICPVLSLKETTINQNTLMA
jgi:hypothetical protein